MKLVGEGALPLSGDAGIPELKRRVLDMDPAPAPAEPHLAADDLYPDYVEHLLAQVERRRPAPLPRRHGRRQRRRRQARAAGLRPHADRRGSSSTSRSTGGSPTTIPIHCSRQTAASCANASWPRRPTWASPGTATPTAASSSTRPAPSCPATSSPRCWPRRCSRGTRAPSILYDLRASRAVPDTIRAAGGTALVNRVGHAFFKQRMRRESVLFGGEVSGHYYFQANHNADSGFIPALLILELLSRKRATMAELLAPLARRYFISGEINSRVDDVPAALARIERRFADGDDRAPRRRLGRLPRLALQRAAVEHRAAAAAQPGRDERGADGRRSAISCCR